MPMYYFHMRDRDTIEDMEGTELSDIHAARGHAETVAQELKYKNDTFLGEDWSHWSMHVHDHAGLELFSFEMTDPKNGDKNDG